MIQSIKNIFRILLLAAMPALCAGCDDTPPPVAVPNPLSFVIPDPDGFDAQLAGLVCQKLQVECQILPSHGLVFLALDRPSNRPVLLTQPYTRIAGRFGAGRDNMAHRANLAVDVQNLDQQKALDPALRSLLQGRRVGVIANTPHAAFLDGLGNGVVVRRYDTAAPMMLDLAAGRLDFGLAAPELWTPFLASSQGQSVALFGPTLVGGPFGAGHGFAMAAEQTALRQAIDQALDGLRHDGALQALSRQFFGADISPPAR